MDNFMVLFKKNYNFAKNCFFENISFFNFFEKYAKWRPIF